MKTRHGLLAGGILLLVGITITLFVIYLQQRAAQRALTSKLDALFIPHLERGRELSWANTNDVVRLLEINWPEVETNRNARRRIWGFLSPNRAFCLLVRGPTPYHPVPWFNCEVDMVMVGAETGILWSKSNYRVLYHPHVSSEGTVAITQGRFLWLNPRSRNRGDHRINIEFVHSNGSSHVWEGEGCAITQFFGFFSDNKFGVALRCYASASSDTVKARFCWFNTDGSLIREDPLGVFTPYLFAIKKETEICMIADFADWKSNQASRVMALSCPDGIVGEGSAVGLTKGRRIISFNKDTLEIFYESENQGIARLKLSDGICEQDVDAAIVEQCESCQLRRSNFYIHQFVGGVCLD